MMYKAGPAGIVIKARESREELTVLVAVMCCRRELIGVRSTWECEFARLLFQLDETLMPAVPGNHLRVKELLRIKGLPVLEHAVDGSPQLLRDNR
jgi:hypothetical protein